MKVCVLGLWHLGSVTAAGLAARGHQVTGFDFDAPRVAQLNAGVVPVFEPGLGLNYFAVGMPTPEARKP